MADEKDKSQEFGGGFTIQDTMELGSGNPELLKDLFDTGSATSTPDEITKIEEEKKKSVPTKTTSKDTTKAPAKKEDEEEEPKEKTLQELLLEEEEGGEEEEPTTAKEDEEEEAPATTKFEALANDLFKLNVFTKDEDEGDVVIKTPEEFLERFNLEKKKGAIETVNNFIGQFGEEYQNAFQAIFVNGTDPKEYFNTFNNIQNFAELDMKQESNQEAVVRQFLSEQGLEAQDLQEEVDKIKSYGDLEKTSEKYHKVLVKRETQKLAQLEQQSAAKLQQESAIKQQYAQNVSQVLQEKLKTKEFDGIPINPKLANELHDFLVTDKYKTASGEKLTDFDRTILDLKRPENHSMKVKVALLLKILEKDPTLSTIQKAGVTKKTDTLFSESVRHTTKSTAKSSKSQEAPKSWFS